MNTLPIIFIPGIMCNVRMWQKQVAHFSTLTEVYVADILVKKSVETIAGDICSKYNKFNLVGFSSGGYIAQEIAARHSSSIEKLVLINTSGGKFAVEYQANRKNIVSECVNVNNNHGMQLFLNKLMSTYTNETSFYKELIDSITCPDPNMFYYQMQSVIEYIEHLPCLNEILCSVLVISSNDDPFLSSQAYAELRDNIPNASLLINDGGGHMLPISRYNYINQSIENFLMPAKNASVEKAKRRQYVV